MTGARYGSVTQLLDATLQSLGQGHEPTTEEEVAASTTVAAPKRRTTAPLGDLIEALDERAFGLMILLLALPCCIPLLWGIPQIVALPMLALAFQLAIGRESPWLPGGLRRRELDIERMRGVVGRASRYLGWLERIASPRLTTLTDGVMVRVVGALMLIPSASILLPLPSTNTAPGIGVAIAAVGLVERDGLLVILGLLFGLAWVAFLVGAFLFLGAEATTIIKDFIRGLV